ncbi:MAG: manganese efflux pump, partial [Bacilli bacterium]
PLSPIVNIEWAAFGIVIQILRSPQEADLDRSGSINFQEAVDLGLALSLDSFGAGLGAAMMGANAPLLAVVVALMTGLFLTIGIEIGKVGRSLSWAKKLTIVPGLILIAIGLLRL